MLGILQTGGPIIAILLVLSVCSLALIVVKIVNLRGTLSGGTERETAFSMWSAGDKAAATKIVENSVKPVDRTLLAAMKSLEAGRARTLLDAELEWRGNKEVAKLQRHIPLLELIAMISPLLGLLGTVLGMIQAFQELAFAEGAANAALLAAGIWQALLTTAAGLIVAIPAAVGATLLNQRVERVAQQIETAVGQLYAIEDERR